MNTQKSEKFNTCNSISENFTPEVMFKEYTSCGLLCDPASESGPSGDKLQLIIKY